MEFAESSDDRETYGLFGIAKDLTLLVDYSVPAKTLAA
jgi:hypothetical protein